MDSIAILDFGSQYAQIIARRVRDAQVYCELFAWDAPMQDILAISPKGFILSGGPKSIYEDNAPHIHDFIFKTGLPILGICYGIQRAGIHLPGFERWKTDQIGKSYCWNPYLSRKPETFSAPTTHETCKLAWDDGMPLTFPCRVIV